MTPTSALAPIRKAAQYFAGAVAISLVAAMSDDHVTTHEALTVVLSGLTAGAVYVAGVAALKNVVAALMLAVQFLVTAVGTEGGLGDLSSAQWIMLAIVVANTLGVVVIPNSGSEPVTT